MKKPSGKLTFASSIFAAGTLIGMSSCGVYGPPEPPAQGVYGAPEYFEDTVDDNTRELTITAINDDETYVYIKTLEGEDAVEDIIWKDQIGICFADGIKF